MARVFVSFAVLAAQDNTCCSSSKFSAIAACNNHTLIIDVIQCGRNRDWQQLDRSCAKCDNSQVDLLVLNLHTSCLVVTGEWICVLWFLKKRWLRVEYSMQWNYIMWYIIYRESCIQDHLCPLPNHLAKQASILMLSAALWYEMHCKHSHIKYCIKQLLKRIELSTSFYAIQQ